MQDTTATPNQAPVENTELTREEARRRLDDSANATPEQLEAASRALGRPAEVKLAEIREPDGRVSGGGTATLGDVMRIPEAELRAYARQYRWTPYRTVRVSPRVTARPRERRDNGRRRGAAQRSSARSGDSGEDGETEPPQVGRLCECGCGRSIDHRRRDARYFEAACRVRVQRARDEADPDRVAERDLARLVAAGADLAPVRCKCDPRRHLVDAGVCLHCGRARELALELAGVRV